MGDRDGADRVFATDGVSRRRPWRRFVLGGAVGAGLVLLLFFLFGAWLLRVNRYDEEGNRFPPDVLADYVPEDCAAVLAVNVRQVRESPIGRKRLKTLLRQLMGQAERRLPWLELIGVNSLEDFDTLQISFPSDGSGEPLLLARGRLDRSRFRIGPDKLQVKLLNGFRVWECSDRSAKQTTLLAVVGDTLVVSKAQGRVEEALKQASNPHSIHVRDSILRELLAKVDRQQSLWLAASIKNLGPVAEIDNYLLKMILRPLLAHAKSVDGGIRSADDLRAEVLFRTASDEDSAQLESDLKSICEAAPGIALLGGNNEASPLLRLLASGQIHREGKSIRLRCLLTADQLEQ